MGMERNERNQQVPNDDSIDTSSSQDRPPTRHSRWDQPESESEIASAPPLRSHLSSSHVIHVFIDPNSGRLVSNDERFHEIDPRLRAQNDPPPQEQPVNDLTAMEGHVEEMVMAIYRMRRLRRELQVLGLTFNESTDGQPSGDDETRTFIEHDSDDNAAEEEMATHSAISTLSHFVRLMELTSPTSQSHNNADRVASSRENEQRSRVRIVESSEEHSPTRENFTTTPHIPSSLGTPPHYGSTPTIEFNRLSAESEPPQSTSPFSSALQVNEEAAQSSRQMDTYNINQQLTEETNTVRNVRTQVSQLETVFQGRSGTISELHPSAMSNPEVASQRWRRLVTSRREMFERMWRQEVEFWSRVEERIVERQNNPTVQFARSFSPELRVEFSPDQHCLMDIDDQNGCGIFYIDDFKSQFWLDDNGDKVMLECFGR